MPSLPLFVSARRTTLQAPVTSSETTSITLKDLKDMYGNALAMSDFGDILYLTINPGNDNAELISATSFTVNSDGTVTIDTDIVRGLSATTPYSTGGTARNHATGTMVVVSNAPQMYDMIMGYMVNLVDAQTVAGKKTFSDTPATTGGDAVDDNDLVRKAQLDSTALGTSSINRIVVQGVVEGPVTAGMLLYRMSDGEWSKADADVASKVDNVLLGIAQGTTTGVGSVPGGILVYGTDSNQLGLNPVEPIYASNTAGGISETPGTVEVSLGYVINSTTIFFAPRYNQQITEDQQDALDAPSSGGALSSSNVVVDNNDTTGTGTIYRGAKIGFGGDGSDGALSITSGATNIDLANAKLVVKNYTSVSITGTGSLTFTNPHSSGTIIVLKSQGNVTLTSSATPMIDGSGLGAAGGASVSGGSSSNGNTGTAGVGKTFLSNAGVYGQSPGAGGAGGAGGAAITAMTLAVFITEYLRYYELFVGAGGASGGYSYGSGTGGASGAGGRGGGCIVMECGGYWNFTTTSGISVAGDDGGDGTTGGINQVGAGGGGGGGGFFMALYNFLTANSGTITVSGGIGGTSEGAGASLPGGGGGGSSHQAGDTGVSSGAIAAKTGGDGADGLSIIQQNV